MSAVPFAKRFALYHAFAPIYFEAVVGRPPRDVFEMGAWLEAWASKSWNPAWR